MTRFPGVQAPARPRSCQVPENTYPTRGCDSGGTFAAYGYGTW
jgi:hypothetical protein